MIGTFDYQERICECAHWAEKAANDQAKVLWKVAYADFLGYIAAPLEFIGGVCILLGLATRYAALAIFAFTIVATLIGHRYWEFTGANYRAQHTQFWKNVSMMGGQLLLFVTAGGRFSVDALLRRK